MLKKVLAIVVAVVLCVTMLVVAIPSMADDSATQELVKEYFVNAAEPKTIAGGAWEVLREDPANPIKYNETTSDIYAEVYLEGTPGASDKLWIDFIDYIPHADSTIMGTYTHEVALSGLTAGRNIVTIPKTQYISQYKAYYDINTPVNSLGLLGRVDARTRTQAAADSTISAGVTVKVGSVYTYKTDKNYVIEAVSTETLTNPFGAITNDGFDASLGAWKVKLPVNTYDTPVGKQLDAAVSVASTTGYLTIHFYYEGAEDNVTSPGNTDTIFAFNVLDANKASILTGDYVVPLNHYNNGWNTLHLPLDGTKSFQYVYAFLVAPCSSMTKLAIGSIYYETLKVADNDDSSDTSSEAPSSSETSSTAPQTEKQYFVAAVKGEEMSVVTFVDGNLCGHAGLKTTEPYTGYGDNTRGAYKALIPTQIYGRSVEKLYATPLDLRQDSNKVTANIYFKGTANDGVAYVFAFFPNNNNDTGKVEKVVLCSDLTEGWNTVTLDVELDTLGAFYIYTMTNDKITDLALGTVYTEVPYGTAVNPEGSDDKEDEDETIYILQATNGQEAAGYSYDKKFDASMNGYGDGKRGAYVSGALASGDWVAANLNGVDLSKSKYAAVNLYVDDPDEFTVATIELSSFSFDQQERNWTITANNVKLKKGWNVIYLDLNNAAGKSAKGTIGYTATDVGGTYDSSAVAFMRMYGTYGGEKTALGAIYVVNSIGGVQTGDAMNIVLVVGTLMLACAAAATATFCGKKARAN